MNDFDDVDGKGGDDAATMTIGCLVRDVEHRESESPSVKAGLTVRDRFQLFRSEIDKNTIDVARVIQRVIDCWRDEDDGKEIASSIGIDDPSYTLPLPFTFARMTMLRTMTRLAMMTPELESLYLPCKAKRYLKDLKTSSNRCVTVLKHILRLDGRIALRSKQSYCENKKRTVYTFYFVVEASSSSSSLSSQSPPGHVRSTKNTTIAVASTSTDANDARTMEEPEDKNTSIVPHVSIMWCDNSNMTTHRNLFTMHSLLDWRSER